MEGMGMTPAEERKPLADCLGGEPSADSPFKGMSTSPEVAAMIKTAAVHLALGQHSPDYDVTGLTVGPDRKVHNPINY